MNLATRSLCWLAPVTTGLAAAAQEPAWNFDFRDSTTSATSPVEVVPTPAGGAVTAGIVRDLPVSNGQSPAHVVISQYDENGDRDWNDRFQTGGAVVNGFLGDRYVDLAIDDAGDVFLLTSFSHVNELRRYAPDGTQRWALAITPPPTSTEFRVRAVEPGPGGTIVVASSWMEGAVPRVDVRSLDASGVELWSWRGDGAFGLANSATGDVRGVAILPSGEVVAYGTDDVDPWPADPHLWCVDGGGVPLWDAHIGCAGFALGEIVYAAIDPAGALVTATTTYASFGGGSTFNVQRIGPDGVETFCTQFPDWMGGHRAPAGVVVDDLGRVFVAISRNTAGVNDHRMELMRLDAAGAFVAVEQPSVVPAGAWSGSTALGLVDGDVVIEGWFGSSPRVSVIARFAPDGSERWAATRTVDAYGSARLAPVPDPRGNVFTLSRRTPGGAGASDAWTIDLVKTSGPEVGSSYCGPASPNSTGAPARMAALGAEDVVANNLTLRVTELPEGSFTLMLASRTQGLAPGAGGGQGTLCLGGAIGRYVAPGQVRRATGAGWASLQLELTTLPQPTGLVSGAAGETWNFQAWYRDANPGITSNFSDAIALTLQ